MGFHFDAKMIIVTLATLVFMGLLLRLYRTLVANPTKLRSLLQQQGIAGPEPSFPLGNIGEIRKAQKDMAEKKKNHGGEPPTTHDCTAFMFPFFEQWRRKYGQTFMFSLGNIQILCVNDPDVVKEITTCTSLDLGKPSYQHKERGPLLGNGILTSNGSIWAHQRKILAPELYMEKVKGMTNLIIESTMILLKSWNSKIETAGGIADIKIDEHLRSFSGDVISRACFGSSYSKGEEIFLKLRELQEVMSRKTFLTGIPGLRYLPTKSNREGWALEKEVGDLILEVAREREEKGSQDKDLLQMVIEGAKNSDFSKEVMERFIIDNCKNIYLAGYETTAVSATWCLMLLASNQEWQDRVRAEVLEICCGMVPDSDMLRKMKQLTMLIHESLRLYPPVTVISREAFRDMKFGDIKVPKGVNVWTLAATLHTDPGIWGQDAYTFNPERFANGITGACKFPHLYMPFGIGPRVCLGQNLAMVELKVLLSLVLSNFSISLSPKYVHSPILRLVIEPEYGVNLLVEKL